MKFSRTSAIPNPNIYVKMLPEYKGLIYAEDEAALLKSNWKSIFKNPERPLDLEIGCGNGFFFEHIVQKHPERNFLGIELKYKPLVQTIRRIKKLNLENGRGIRFHAKFIGDLLGEGEIDNVFIHFPDPWPKHKHAKNRLVNSEFLNKLFKIQKPGSWIDFKTDSESYFDFVNIEVKKSPYEVIRYTRDLHRSEWSSENFQTAFEKIFTRKSQPTYYMRLRRA